MDSVELEQTEFMNCLQKVPKAGYYHRYQVPMYVLQTKKLPYCSSYGITLSYISSRKRHVEVMLEAF